MCGDCKRIGWPKPGRLLWLPVLVLLAGCGGPSDENIKSVLQDAAKALMGPTMAPVVENVSNVDCREAQGKPGYVCSFKATVFNKMMNNRVSQTNEARFVQDNSKWVLMEDK